MGLDGNDVGVRDREFFLGCYWRRDGRLLAGPAGPRIVAMVGVALWGAGNVLAGLGTSSLGAPWLYASYRFIGGIGAGMAYITPLSMVSKWFPDRKGLAGGLVAGAFGLGAFIYNQIVPRLAGFHTAAVHAAVFIGTRAAAKAQARALIPPHSRRCRSSPRLTAVR